MKVILFLFCWSYQGVVKRRPKGGVFGLSLGYLGAILGETLKGKILLIDKEYQKKNTPIKN